MKKTKLIEAIKETIIDLKENRKIYQWTKTKQCNCGILAENLGIFVTGLEFSWGLEAHRCSQTDRPYKDVFIKLQAAGLSLLDICELEVLGNPEICKRAGLEIENDSCPALNKYALKNKNYDIKENVIKYLSAWLEILLEENQIPEPIKATPMHFIKREEMPEVIFNN